LLAHGRWFSPGTPASSALKTDRHDIAEILLKVALKHQKSKSNHLHPYPFFLTRSDHQRDAAFSPQRLQQPFVSLNFSRSKNQYILIKLTKSYSNVF
jgi:hypothetical protein